MAKATVRMEKVSVPQPPVIEEKRTGITLELSDEEAQYLANLTACVATPMEGNPANSHIYFALSGAGVRWKQAEFSIKFKEAIGGGIPTIFYYNTAIPPK